MKPIRLHFVAFALAVPLSLQAANAWADEDIFVRAGSDGSLQLSNLPDAADYEVLVAAPPAPPQTAIAAAVVSVDGALAVGVGARAVPYRDAVERAAKSAHIEARLVHAVIAVESGYNAVAVSRKGAVGLMQLMPETARRYGVGDSRNPDQNVRAGAQYLADLLKVFDNDLGLALAAYNAGEKAVRQHGRRIPPYPETAAYVPKVMAVYRKLKTLSI